MLHVRRYPRRMPYRNARMKTRTLPSLALAITLTACASAPATSDADAPLPEVHTGSAKASGYLSPEHLPDSLALLPPPPTAGSPAYALDEAVARASFALRDTPRWHFASAEADTAFPHGASAFACALRQRIDAGSTPAIYRLLQRSLIDAAHSVKGAKQHYQRQRPFIVNGQPVCTPDDTGLRSRGSYPSGHAAIGWTWALILSELAPERATALQARGLAYGEDRVVCNAHWASDVRQGRLLGAATVAALHADATFRRDLDAARAELANTSAAPDPQTCATEDAALALPLSGVD